MGRAYHTLVCHFWPNRCSLSPRANMGRPGDCGHSRWAMCTLPATQRAQRGCSQGDRVWGCEAKDGPMAGRGERGEEVGLEVRAATGARGERRLELQEIQMSDCERRGMFYVGVLCLVLRFASERPPRVPRRAGLRTRCTLEDQQTWDPTLRTLSSPGLVILLLSH